jgi:hypothetical protein
MASAQTPTVQLPLDDQPTTLVAINFISLALPFANSL